MNDSQAVDLIQDLVRIPSVSGQEQEAVGFLLETLKAHGFETGSDAGGNALGRLGEAGPRMALVGHVDTVPGEVPVRIVDGKLFGRGSVDAKGCLAAFIVAAIRAQASGSLAMRIEFAACTEEEVPSSRGAHALLDSVPPDALIIGEPSGARAVTTGYKGFLAARLRREIALEHTAGPGEGIAAAACRQYVGLAEAAGVRNEGVEALYDQLLIHLESVQSGTDGRFEHAELRLKLRLPDDLDPAAARAWVAAAAPDWTAEFTGGVPAWSGPRTSPLARHLGRAIGTAGHRTRYLRKTGTADLNLLAPAWGCPSVAYGPGDSALDHAPNEHLELSEYLEAIEVLQRLFQSADAARAFEAVGAEA